MSFFTSLSDDSIKRIPIENIKLPWLPEFNSLSRGAVEYEHRPNTWGEYFIKVREIREKVVCVFNNLEQVLKNGGDVMLLDSVGWDECEKYLSGEFLLPKCAVDEWGFLTESRMAHLEGGVYTRFSSISTLDPFTKAFDEYTRTLSYFFSQALKALVLVPRLKTSVNEKSRRAILNMGEKIGVNENLIHLSVVNAIDACIALRVLQYTERGLLLRDRLGLDDSFAQNELDQFTETVRSWMFFCYPNQVLPNTAKQAQRKKKNTIGWRPKQLRDFLRSTENRLSQELKKLKNRGIDAKVLNELFPWNDEPCLWISFDTSHPLGSLIAVETVWRALVEAFRPDRDKIVRMKTIDYLWSKIVLVPLVQGRSLNREAYANMKSASYPFDEAPAKQLWRFVPEEIPKLAWDQLGVSEWTHPERKKVLDDFTTAYEITFQHLDHMADFTRCKVALDDDGKRILLEYLQRAAERVEPILKETLDTFSELLKHFPEFNEKLIEDRPNISNCLRLVLEIKDAFLPSKDFDSKCTLIIDAIEDWRNRLKDGLNLLGEARALWMADYFGITGFDYQKNLQ